MGNGKEVIKFIETLRVENNELKQNVSKKLGIDYFTFCWFHKKSESNISVNIIKKIINGYKMTNQQKSYLIEILNKSAYNEVQTILFKLYLEYNLNIVLLSKKLNVCPSLLQNYCLYKTSNINRIKIKNKLINLFPNSINDILKMDKIVKYNIDKKIEKTYNKRLSKSVNVSNINMFEIRKSLELTQLSLAKTLSVTYQRIDQI